MLSFEKIAEQRIAEAVERGELSGLEGEGEPLRLDDDAMIPEELRMANRVLVNAGFLPEGVTLRARIADALVEQQAAKEPHHAARAGKKLALLLARLEGSSSMPPAVLDAYRDAVLKKVYSEEESPPPSRPLVG